MPLKTVCLLVLAAMLPAALLPGLLHSGAHPGCRRTACRPCRRHWDVPLETALALQVPLLVWEECYDWHASRRQRPGDPSGLACICSFLCHLPARKNLDSLPISLPPLPSCPPHCHACLPGPCRRAQVGRQLDAAAAGGAGDGAGGAPLQVQGGGGLPLLHGSLAQELEGALTAQCIADGSRLRASVL